MAEWTKRGKRRKNKREKQRERGKRLRGIKNLSSDSLPPNSHNNPEWARLKQDAKNSVFSPMSVSGPTIAASPGALAGSWIRAKCVELDLVLC